MRQGLELQRLLSPQHLPVGPESVRRSGLSSDDESACVILLEELFLNGTSLVFSIHHVVDITATRSKVWWALTKPGRLTGWWGTKVATTPAVVGAKLHWTFGGDFNPVMQMGPWTG